MDTYEDLYACPGTIPAHIHLSSYDKNEDGNERSEFCNLNVIQLGRIYKIRYIRVVRMYKYKININIFHHYNTN